MTNDEKRYFCGIDIGASAAKLAVIDGQRAVVGKACCNSGIDYTAAAERCRDEALACAGLSPAQIVRCVSTGYGRDNVPWADERMTEIACHAKGAFHHFRRPMTVIDIGAQDSKVIHLDGQGRRINFRMNRKCAAGTGAFLEEIARRMDCPPDQLNALAQRSTKEVTLGSFCTVFAATEILEKIRHGEKVEDIVKGAFRSVAKRILEMDAVQGSLVMTGGVVAHNPYLATMIGQMFGAEVSVPPDPQFIGAFGAALFAADGFLALH